MAPASKERAAGMCAGGYYAAAAIYSGNLIALAVLRPDETLPACLMGVIPLGCIAMGITVVRASRRLARISVVVASGFCAMHLTGLAYLFLLTPDPGLPLTRSLQWQLGGGLFLLWVAILGAAFRLAQAVEAPEST